MDGFCKAFLSCGFKIWGFKSWGWASWFWGGYGLEFGFTGFKATGFRAQAPFIRFKTYSPSTKLLRVPRGGYS